VSDVVAGGGVDGCGAVPGREVVAGGEAGDVSDLDQQSRSAGGSDAVQVQQAGAGRCDELPELFVRGLPPRVDPLEVRDQLGRDPASGLAHDVPGPHGREQCLGLGSGQALLRTTRDHQQQRVQLGDHPRVVLAQGKPLWNLLPTLRWPARACQMRATRTCQIGRVGSLDGSDRPATWTEPRQACSEGQRNK